MSFSHDAVMLGTEPPSRRAVRHDWWSDPNLVISGRAGSGKTVVSENLIAEAAFQGARVLFGMAHPTMPFHPVTPFVDTAVSGIPEALSLLGEAQAESARRQKMLKSYRVPSFLYLPSGVRPRRMIVVLEEYLSLGDAPGVESAAMTYLYGLGSAGRTTGVNVVLVSQRVPDLEGVRDQFAVLLMGRTPEAIRRLTFRRPDKAPQLSWGRDRGCGVYEHSAGVAEVQVPYFR